MDRDLSGDLHIVFTITHAQNDSRLYSIRVIIAGSLVSGPHSSRHSHFKGKKFMEKMARGIEVGVRIFIN